MASCENKYTTLLDLSRQAKVITGETACFDGKIEAGIPFSGYPTGVDTNTIVSLGVVSSETAVFSGNTGTTVFDVSNTGSTNYNSIFSGYSGTVWTNALFSGNTSGLTLPITTISADTQVVGADIVTIIPQPPFTALTTGPIWTLTQTATTSNGEHIIGIQYTGYTITYSFSQLEQLSVTAYTAYSGFSSASQENFSAGTLDYKGPLDYISSVEDATIDGRLTTDRLTVTGGASLGTLGYVLTQTGNTGESGWLFNSASASTQFTGNTSGTCITDLYLTNLYGCSPLHIEPSGLNDVYMMENGGNVGIGTTSPTSPLHISSDNTVNRGLYIQTNYSGNSVNEGIRVLNWTDSVETPLITYGGLFWGRANSQNRFSYGVIGAAGLASWTQENVMIGVRGVAGTSMSNDINAYGLYGESIVSNGGNNIGGYFVSKNVGSGNAYAIIVPPSGGTVGINTETPTEKLHVEGSVRVVDGTEQNGYVLTCDANGVGSWQASSGNLFSSTERSLNNTPLNFGGSSGFTTYTIQNPYSDDPNSLLTGSTLMPSTGGTFTGKTYTLPSGTLDDGDILNFQLKFSRGILGDLLTVPVSDDKILTTSLSNTQLQIDGDFYDDNYLVNIDDSFDDNLDPIALTAGTVVGMGFMYRSDKPPSLTDAELTGTTLLNWDTLVNVDMVRIDATTLNITTNVDYKIHQPWSAFASSVVRGFDFDAIHSSSNTNFTVNDMDSNSIVFDAAGWCYGGSVASTGTTTENIYCDYMIIDLNKKI